VSQGPSSKTSSSGRISGDSILNYRTHRLLRRKARSSANDIDEGNLRWCGRNMRISRLWSCGRKAVLSSPHARVKPGHVTSTCPFFAFCFWIPAYAGMTYSFIFVFLPRREWRDQRMHKRRRPSCQQFFFRHPRAGGDPDQTTPERTGTRNKYMSLGFPRLSLDPKPHASDEVVVTTTAPAGRSSSVVKTVHRRGFRGGPLTHAVMGIP